MTGLIGLNLVVGLMRLTGLIDGLDRSDQCSRSLSTIRDFHGFRSVKRISCGASPSHPININGHGRLRFLLSNRSNIQLLSFMSSDARHCTSTSSSVAGVGDCEFDVIQCV